MHTMENATVRGTRDGRLEESYAYGHNIWISMSLRGAAPCMQHWRQNGFGNLKAQGEKEMIGVDLKGGFNPLFSFCYLYPHI